MIKIKKKSVYNLKPDSVYKDLVISKFINLLMEDGKKEISEKIIYQSLNLLKQDKKKDPLVLFYLILEKLKPLVETSSKRVGGRTRQIPKSIKITRQQSLALKWLVDCAKGRKEKTMVLRLTQEYNDILKGQGLTLKKRDDLHRVAEANKAFIHFR